MGRHAYITRSPTDKGARVLLVVRRRLGVLVGSLFPCSCISARAFLRSVICREGAFEGAVALALAFALAFALATSTIPLSPDHPPLLLILFLAYHKNITSFVHLLNRFFNITRPLDSFPRVALIGTLPGPPRSKHLHPRNPSPRLFRCLHSHQQSQRQATSGIVESRIAPVACGDIGSVTLVPGLPLAPAPILTMANLSL